MINKIKEIEQENLQKIIKIGLYAINHKHLFNKIFTQEDIASMVSYDGVNVTMQIKDRSTTVSIVDTVNQSKKNNKVDEYLRILDSPYVDIYRYEAYLSSDLVLFIQGDDKHAFKDCVDGKIMFYNDDLELCYIHENFYFDNYFENKYSISEFYIGYDFDPDYNPVGKLFVANRRGLYDGIADKYNSKFRIYYDKFNVDDELLLLKHYLLMGSLEKFDDIFTQFHGPLQQPLDLELLKNQFELADMILFNQ